jgi:hypothetical protein
LHGYDNWSHILRKKLRLRAFANGVLNRIFGPQREEDLLEEERKFARPNDPESYAGGSVSSW